MSGKSPKRAVKAGIATLFGTWGGVVALAGVGFLIAWMFVQPAPPARAVIATGGESGA